MYTVDKYTAYIPHKYTAYTYTAYIFTVRGYIYIADIYATSMRIYGSIDYPLTYMNLGTGYYYQGYSAGTKFSTGLLVPIKSWGQSIGFYMYYLYLLSLRAKFSTVVR